MDLAFGKKNEIKCKKQIETITGGLISTTDPFDTFDYYNDDWLVELKTRRNNYSRYPTTMIGLNKTFSETKKQKLFCFRFLDGLYYHIYEPNTKYNISKGGRCDRGCAEIKDYLFIPINKLIFICN